MTMKWTRWERKFWRFWFTIQIADFKKWINGAEPGWKITITFLKKDADPPALRHD